jgi:hypothetical protein
VAERTWSKLEAVVEDVTAPKDIEPQSCARQGHDQTAHVSQVADGFRAHKREQDDVILLALEAVDRRHACRHAKEGRPGAPLAQDVTDEVLLAVVRREDRNF